MLPINITALPYINTVLLIAINFVAATLMVTIIIHHHFRDWESRIFLLMGILILTWVNFAYLARWVGENNLYLSEIFLRVAWVATPPLFYVTYLISVFIMGEGKKRIWLKLSLFILTVILSILTAYGNLVIRGVSFSGGSLDIIYGPGFYPFLAAIFILMFFTLLPVFWVKLTRSSRFFLTGVVIFYVFNSAFNIVLPLFFRVTRLYYLGDYSTVFLLGLTMYAILRHGLFDIKVVATEILTVVIWSILLVKIFINTSSTEGLTDLVVFVLMVIFGVLLIRSVVKEVEQRRELERLTKKLRELDKTKNEFISVAAHELRAPLTAVKGYTSMIIEGDTGPISEKANEFLQDTLVSTARMIRLVNNMLDVGRIEEERIIYQEDYCDVVEIVKQAFGEFELEAKRSSLSYNLEASEDLVARVYVDRDRLHEVVVNFLSNALKYTDEGGVIVRITNPQKNKIKVEVVDTGRGITAKEQKKLFRKFYRVKSNIGKTIGSGLGLYISKLLIEKFSGEIGVDSVPGKGSNFWFVLPTSENDGSLDERTKGENGS